MRLLRPCCGKVLYFFFYVNFGTLCLNFFKKKKKLKLNFVKSNVNLMLEHIITY